MCSTQKRTFTHTQSKMQFTIIHTYGFQRLYLEGTYCIKIIDSNGDDKREMGIIEFNSNIFVPFYVFCFVVITITQLSFASEIA